MPNHCWNYLEVVDGDVKLLEPYFTKTEDQYGKVCFFDFEKVIPMPEGYKDDGRWYDWSVANWGTKWNSYDGTDLNEHDAGIGFNTAWSPPIPVVVELAKELGKTLRLVYDEPGIDFCGECVANPDGSYEDKEYSPRTNAPDYLKDYLMIEEEEELDNV